MRGIYDKEAGVYGILDSAIVCTSPVIDGQPYCTPTSFWREGDHAIGTALQRACMIRSQAQKYLRYLNGDPSRRPVNLARVCEL